MGLIWKDIYIYELNMVQMYSIWSISPTGEK